MTLRYAKTGRCDPLHTPPGRRKFVLTGPDNTYSSIPTANSFVAMSWAQRLKRVFNIDAEACRVCGAAARLIDWIEYPVVIRKILNHLQGCRS